MFSREFSGKKCHVLGVENQILTNVSAGLGRNLGMLIYVIPFEGFIGTLQNTEMCIRTYQSRRLILVTDHRVVRIHVTR